jgi:hypothetical protein
MAVFMQVKSKQHPLLLDSWLFVLSFILPYWYYATTAQKHCTGDITHNRTELDEASTAHA